MSYDVTLVAETTDGNAVTVFDANMTSNCAPAWDAAGCPLRDFHDAKAADLGRLARIAAQRLRDEPQDYRDLIRGGGDWGTVETARDFMERIADACQIHPSATVLVSS